MPDNTIYDYYERVNDRFYVALCFPDREKANVKFIWEPLARKVVIARFEDFDFFMLGKMKNLELYEGLSGSIILRQSDMGSRRLRRCKCGILVENIPDEIKRRGGRGYLNRAIVNFICEHDKVISPRYIVKKI